MQKLYKLICTKYSEPVLILGSFTYFTFYDVGLVEKYSSRTRERSKTWCSAEFCSEIVKTVQYAAGKIFQWKVSTTPTTTKGSLCQLGQPTSKPWKSEILKGVIFLHWPELNCLLRDRSEIFYKLARVTYMQKNMSKSCKWVRYVFK